MRSSLLLAGVLFALGAYGQVSTTNLTAEYLFNGASVNDTWGTTNLTLTGTLAAAAPNRAGGANRAISLNGDHLVRTGTTGNAITTSFWIKTTTNDANKRVVIDQSERAAATEGSAETGWYAYLQNGKIGVAGNFQWYYNNNTVPGATGYIGWANTEANTVISDGNWHHVAIVFTPFAGSWWNAPFARFDRIISMTYVVYIDNVQGASYEQVRNVGTATGPQMRRFIEASVPITIANSRVLNSANRYQDIIDDIRYYNRALSAAEVTALATEAAESTPATIAKSSQTITFNALPAKAFGDANFTLGATATSGLPVTYTSSNSAVATVTGNTVTITGVGTTSITASQGGNMAFDPAANVANTLTVSPVAQTITFAALAAKVYGNPAFVLSATATSGLPVSFASSDLNVATISGNTVTIVGAGSTTITASQDGNTNYSAASAVQRVLTVNKATQTITFNSLLSKVVGDASFSLGASSTSGLAVSFTSSNTGVATIAGNTVTIVAAGSTVITAMQAGNTNYNAATNAQQTLVVNKGNQTISFGAIASKTFGDPSFTLSATSSSTLPVSYSSSNTSVATLAGNTVTIVGVGTTTITASQAGNGNYNAAPNAAQTFTVGKANQVLTFGSLVAKSFGDAPFTLGATTSSGLAISYTSSNTNVATVSGNTATIVGTGTTTITASQAGNSNYSPGADVQQILTVGKGVQTITFGALPTKFMADASFTLSATTSSGLPVAFTSSNPGVATISGTTVTIVAVGTTDITASQGGEGNYEAAADVVQVLTVSAKQDQTITFAPLADVVFGSLPFALTATASSSLPVSYSAAADKLQINGTQATVLKSGRVSVTANQSGNNQFNAAAPVTQSFCINPAKPVVTLTNGNTASITLTSNAAIGNKWFRNGIAIEGAANQVLIVSEPGTYKVRVQADDCLSAFSDDQRIITTAIEPGTVNSVVGVNVYPNPAIEELIIDLEGFVKNSPVFVSAVDLLGRTANQLTGEGGNKVRMDVRSFVPGQYIILLRQGNVRITKSFVKSSN